MRDDKGVLGVDVCAGYVLPEGFPVPEKFSARGVAATLLLPTEGLDHGDGVAGYGLSGREARVVVQGLSAILTPPQAVDHKTADARTSQPPRFNHDCNACHFLGAWSGADLYYCPGDLFGGSVVARHSDVVHEYTSIGVDLLAGGHPPFSKSSTPELWVALRIAELAGWV